MPPLAALSLWMEGWDAVALGLRNADSTVWAAVAWQAWGNSLFGYAALVMGGLALNLLWPKWRQWLLKRPVTR